MGKKYKVKDINKNGKIDSWEQAKYDKINAQGPAAAGFLKRLNNAGGIAGLLQSQPGSQSVLKPNRSVNNMSNMVRQQPREPMGMDVSTNAQVLNDAYNFNNLGMAKIGKIQEARNKGYKGMDLQGALAYLDNKPVNKITPKGIDTSNKGPAQFGSTIVDSNTEKPKTRSQKRLEKTKQKAADARKETTSKETAAKGRVSKTKSKTQQKRDKTKR